MRSLEDIKKKTLILTQTNPQTDLMFKSWLNDGLSARIIFKPVKKDKRAFRRVWTYFGLPGIKLWLNDWYKELDNYDTVILHASEVTMHIPEVIHSINPNIRIIVWYWNLVTRGSLPNKTRDKNSEFWTFDVGDADKYGLNRNIQYYNWDKVKKSGHIKYDLYFVGRDKGRKDEIDHIVSKIKAMGFLCDIKLILNEKDSISYDEVCQDIANSRSILEVNQYNQKGCTLRALESLFFEKKLITNNTYIKDIDFYNPNNIFIIGHDPWNKFKSFMNTPYDTSVNKYKKDYTIDQWLMNFFKEN